MPNVADHLKAGFSGLSLDEALRLPASALLGVSDSAADALKRIGVETIFDLGSSWLFSNASGAIEAATGEPGLSSTHLLEELPVAQPDDAASLPLESLRGMSDEDATAIKQALALETIREFALWPPRQVAQRLVREASGAGADPEEVHAEALRPRLGEYPTERVYYNSLVMLGMVASGDQQPLTGTISLQPAVDDPAGFGRPAVGALVTLSQSWYAKGITLGHMLHSLALAPGEATRIAVVDWSRRTRATVSETIEEAESLDSATEHSRAISEVQNAVANEMQSGGSMSSGWAKSTSKGKAGGFSIGGGVAGAYQGVTGVLGFGGGTASSKQESETTTEAASSSWSIGNRSVMAEMAQRVNDRTEQHSTSVRNRRASAVREVSQSEHEQVSTRVVANYNHMHALTVQYYEVVQIYRVLVQVHSAQRVLFLPFELLDFSGDGAANVVARFRGQLLTAALTERVAALLLDDRGEVQIRAAIRVQLPSLFSDVVGGLATAASMARTSASAGGSSAPPSGGQPAPTPGPVLTAPGPAVGRRITSPGPVLDTVPGDVELVAASFDGVRVDRVRLDQGGVPADNSTFAVPSTTFQVDFPGGLPLRNITAIHITKMDAEADAGTMTLHYRSATQQLALPVPLDLAAGTSMQKVAFLAADPSNRKEELMAHLQANRAYYSQAVLGNLDSATLVMLLSRFTWRGKPLADQVEPNPLAVAGNYLVLRAPIEDDEAAGIDGTGTTWGELLRQRALTFEQRDDRLVPIPTGGVFAEAVLGRSNSAEKLDITRFWNWQDSPIPLQPPEIAPVSTGSRATAEDLKPGQLGAPVLNILNPSVLPDPAGLTAALSALASANMFRDMSGLAGTQAVAQAASAGTLSAATEAGRLASANLKTVTDQAVAMGQAAADMWKVLQSKKGGDTSAGGRSSGSNVSADGARINHGRDMDERSVSDAGASDLKMTESQAEFQAAGGGGGGGTGGGTGGGAPISRELAFADVAATGVSPALLSGTTNALGSGAASAVAANLAVGSILPGFVTRAIEWFILKIVHVDVEASGMLLPGVNLHPMHEHALNAQFQSIGFFAWTNSGTDIFVDTEAFLRDLSALQQNQGKSSEDAALFMRGLAVIVVRHEAEHIRQFAVTGRPPSSFKQMVTFEREAYGCGSTPIATSSLTWLNDAGSGGARDFLVNTLGLKGKEATELIQMVRPQFVTNCTTLENLNNLTAPTAAELDKLIQRGFIKGKMLPKELVKGQGDAYIIDDLYKA
jgi:hypothetical protein